MWRFLRRAIFTGDREWAWRRRGIICGVTANLSGIVQVIWFPGEQWHDALVMPACQAGLMGCLGLYIVGATADDQLKRRAPPPPKPKQPEEPAPSA